MEMGTIGSSGWVPWNSHGNGSDNDYIVGMEIKVGIKVWNKNRAMGMGMNFYCSFSTYHIRFCSVIRELGKHSHFNFTLTRACHFHFINVYCD